ncbi:hypothetical protein Syun_003735 [Stephania yunnanensis]|uniref:Uncharacterized protein n=1 Tax=Stephania yunnanensis TaxID=152371 RepID=A0AAP0Q0H8_9MAGN
MPYYPNFNSHSFKKPISPPTVLLICSIFLIALYESPSSTLSIVCTYSIPLSTMYGSSVCPLHRMRLLRPPSPLCALPLFALSTVCSSSVHRVHLLYSPSPQCALPLSTLSIVCTSSIRPLHRVHLLCSPSPSCSPFLPCSEGDHSNFLKSFIIGSVVFNILVGFKPRSFSPVFPIVGEIQAKLVRSTLRLGSLARKKTRYADPKLIGNAHGLWCEYLSSSTIATTSEASSLGWDGSNLFTTVAA